MFRGHPSRGFPHFPLGAPRLRSPPYLGFSARNAFIASQERRSAFSL